MWLPLLRGLPIRRGTAIHRGGRLSGPITGVRICGLDIPGAWSGSVVEGGLVRSEGPFERGVEHGGLGGVSGRNGSVWNGLQP